MEEYDIAQIMDRIRGMGGGSRGNMRPEDIDMEARNSKLGKPVPGLPGVHFSPDIGTASRKAAASTALWNSPDRMSHPAIGFSQGKAGIGTADTAINSIMPRLNEKGIYRDSTGTWQIRGTGGSQGGSDALGIATKVKGNIANGPQTQVPQIGQNRPVPGVIPPRQGTAPMRIQPPTNANGGNVSVGNIPGNTTTNINVSGGQQTSNGRTTTGTPGQATVNGGPVQTGPYPAPGSPTATRSTPGGSPVFAPANFPGPGGTNPIQYTPSTKTFPTEGQGVGRTSGAGIQEIVPSGTTLGDMVRGGQGINPQPGGTLRDILMSVTNQPTQQATSSGYMSPDSQLGQMQQQNANGQPVNAAYPTGGTTAPHGAIQAPLVLGNATGGSYDTLAPYEEAIQAATAKYPEVDPAMVRAAIMMESQGDMYASNPDSSSYGVLQIQPEWHRAAAEAMGLHISDESTGYSNPADDIMYWTALMAGKVPGNVPPGNTPMERYYNNYGTGDAYFQDVQSMMDEQHAMTPASSPQQQLPPYSQNPGVGDVGNLGLKIIPTPQQLPGSAVGGQTGGQLPPAGGQQGGVLVGEEAAGQGGFDPNVAFPGSSAPMDAPGTGMNRKIGGSTPVVDPASGASIDPSTGQPLPGNATPAPSTSRPPRTTGTISGTATPTPDQMTGIVHGSTPVQQGDGLGIYAGPDADESWIQTLNPSSGGVNGDYKQYVCDSQSGGYYGQDGCCQGCGRECCNYHSTTEYFDPRSADQTVHPGYDINLPQGETFYAPVDAVVLGYGTYNDPANAVADGPGCVSPGDGSSAAKSQINHCNWAYDNGLALGGWSDTDGSPIVISFDHIDPTIDPSMVGQQVPAGTPLAVGTYTQNAGHTHVEAHGFCAESGTNVILDPSLVMGGFYNSHSACEGITRPVQETQADAGSSYMGTDAYNSLKSQYAQSQVDQGGGQQSTYTTDAAQGYSPAPQTQSYEPTYTSQETQQYQQPLPPPAYYDQGASTGQTYQVTTDSAGRQYEIMADGSSRLIYDPSW